MPEYGDFWEAMDAADFDAAIRIIGREEAEDAAGLDELLAAHMDRILKMMRAGRGLIALVGDDGKPEMVAARASNISESALDSVIFHSDEFAVNRDAIEKAIDGRKPVLSCGASDDAGPSRSPHQSLVFRAIICTPMIAGERVIGAIYLDNRMKTGVFKKDDLEVLDIISRHMAKIIEPHCAILISSHPAERINPPEDIIGTWAGNDYVFAFARGGTFTVQDAKKSAEPDAGTYGFTDEKTLALATGEYGTISYFVRFKSRDEIRLALLKFPDLFNSYVRVKE